MGNIVVLGGGAGGIAAARSLVGLAKSEHSVTLVTDHETYTYCPALPMLMVGKRNPQDIQSDYTGLSNSGIQVEIEAVTGIDTLKREICSRDDTLGYDALLCALGMTCQPEKVPGFAEFALNAYSIEGAVEIRKRLMKMTRGDIVIFISSFPIKCPGAPYEIAFLIHQFLTERKLRAKIGITVVTPEPTPESAAPPPVGKSFRDAMAQAGITLLTESKMLSVGEGALYLDHDQTILGDLMIGIPSQRGPQIAVDNSGIVDGAGFLIVDPLTLETPAPGVFAIGDNAALRFPVIGSYAPKTASFAYRQADAAAANIIAYLNREKPKEAYKGKADCTINVGFGEARLGTIDYYHEPAPIIRFGKPSASAFLKKQQAEASWFKALGK